MKNCIWTIEVEDYHGSRNVWVAVAIYNREDRHLLEELFNSFVFLAFVGRIYTKFLLDEGFSFSSKLVSTKNKVEILLNLLDEKGNNCCSFFSEETLLLLPLIILQVVA